MTLEDVQTPALVLNRSSLKKNTTRMRAAIDDAIGEVAFRPHLKTTKCIEIAKLLAPSVDDPITVSTLKEAEMFAAAGMTNILYAVGIIPAKLPRVAELRKKKVNLTIVTDNLMVAHVISGFSKEYGLRLPTVIEIDIDGHRSGVNHTDKVQQNNIAKALGHNLEGIMAHSGGSYAAHNETEIVRAANAESSRIAACAKALRQSGFALRLVSIGSTPAALNYSDLSGISEVRAGVFTLFDLVMAGIGACRIDEIAISVLTSVIGHRPDKGWVIVDAGWMAMSRDRGTKDQRIDQGYGLVCDISGHPFGDMIMINANQEHGILALRSGSGDILAQLPVGTKLRILPNHACATSAQHDRYYIVDSDDQIAAQWPRFGGW